MGLFQYDWYSPIRILLPVAIILFVLPPTLPETLMNYFAFPIFYFFGSYFIFLNFPGIARSLQHKPLYIEDLVITKGVKDETFKQIYNVFMDFILAILFAVAAESVAIQGIEDRKTVEIIALIGGTYSFYIKMQDMVGKYLLKLCHCIKEIDVYRRNDGIELQATKQSIEEKKDGV